MTDKRRATDADYAAMAADYEANPVTADEIAGPIEIGPAFRSKDGRSLAEIFDEAAREAEEARDQDDGEPLPPHVTVSRPNRAGSEMLQVRLNPAEYDAVERLAARRGLPASTIARACLLKMVGESESTEVRQTPG